MKATSFACLVATALALLIPNCCMAGERTRRLKDKEGASPNNGVLLFSQIKTHKKDLLWGFEVGAPGERSRYVAGREVRFPNGFYDIGCGRVGSVTAISLAPGMYELGPWHIKAAMFMIGPYSRDELQGPKKRRYTIEVREGEINYVGEISIDEKQDNIAIIKDNFECEKEYLEKTWPWMTSLSITRAESTLGQ